MVLFNVMASRTKAIIDFPPTYEHALWPVEIMTVNEEIYLWAELFF
jgi:hypothetical protein